MTEQNTPNPIVFQLEKIYIKDSSFEAPHAPQVFLEQKSPEVGVQLTIGHSPLDAGQGLYEVVLAVTVNARQEDRSVFLAEAHQAGLFRIQGLVEDELAKALEIGCTNVLLPFVRQELSRMIESGGFPQLLINPINFEALYLQKHSAAPQPAAAH